MRFATPRTGGGGLAFRGSHELAVAAWRATPNSIKLRIEEELAKRMGWSVAKAAQMTNVLFSMSSGEGGSNEEGTEYRSNPEIVAQEIADSAVEVGSGTPWRGSGKEPQWSNPKSTGASH